MTPKIHAFQSVHQTIEVPIDVVAFAIQLIVLVYIVGYNVGKLSKN